MKNKLLVWLTGALSTLMGLIAFTGCGKELDEKGDEEAKNSLVGVWGSSNNYNRQSVSMYFNFATNGDCEYVYYLIAPPDTIVCLQKGTYTINEENASILFNWKETWSNNEYYPGYGNTVAMAMIMSNLIKTSATDADYLSTRQKVYDAYEKSKK